PAPTAPAMTRAGSPGPAPTSTRDQASSHSMALDDNVQFTAYRPSVVRPAEWYALLVFAHLSERPPDSDPSTPDPVEEVRRQAQQLLGDSPSAFKSVTADSLQAVPREGELTFLPHMDGVEFNPRERRFLWNEPVHREEFRLRASPEIEGRTARGMLT